MRIKNIITYSTKSFTLTEVIISMIIMSFLALASYALFVNTGNLIQSQQEDVMKTIDHSLYYTTLYSDISRAHNIEISNTSQLLLDNDITQDITYTFADTYIVRKFAQRIDTFAIACKLVIS